MKRNAILLTVLAVASLTWTTSADAQKRKHQGGRNQVKIKVNFKGAGQAHHHHHRHVQHQKIQTTQWKHNHGHHCPVIYRFPVKVQYVTFCKFPYKVCWYNGQYWVRYGGVWIPYRYVIQQDQNCWNWHQTYFHLQKHPFK